MRDTDIGAPFELGYTDCTPLLDASLCAAAISKLPPWRAKKAEAVRQPRDRALVTGAGLLFRHMLLQAGVPRQQLDTCISVAQGKPALRPFHPSESSGTDTAKAFSVSENGSNAFPNQVPGFNLSHSGRYAACIVGAGMCGIDIEQIKEKGNFSRVAERFFCENERIYLKSEETSEAFYKIWTLKESYMKYTGMGFALVPGKIHSDIKQRRVWADELPEAQFSWFVRRDAVLCACIDTNASMAEPCFYDINRLLDT